MLKVPKSFNLSMYNRQFILFNVYLFIFVFCFAIETKKSNLSLFQTHKDVVSCVVLGEDGRTLVTGSVDTTVVKKKNCFLVVEKM